MFTKNQGKSGIVREFSIISSKSGKNYLVSILFSLTIGMVVRKVVALFVVSQSEFCY